MPNPLSKVVDYYFELIDQEPVDYKRHLRAAKDLLELCDGSTDIACEILDKTQEWVTGFGGEEWAIDTAVKNYLKFMPEKKEQKQLLKAPGTISKITTMEDRVLRLQIDAQEMTPEDEAVLLGLRDKVGWFVFAPNLKDITEEDLNLPEVKVEKGEKSPGQRLRAVLFIAWKQQKRKEDFDIFYKSYMNRVIENIKTKLEPEK